MPRLLAGLGLLLLLAGGGLADPAHLAGVELTRRPYGKWELILALDHEDTDRSHFVDRVDAVDQDGKRVFFAHFYGPLVKDVEEDGPVRRRFRHVPIPEGVNRLTFRAHCRRTGWGGKPLEVDLARREGPGFRIASRRHRYLADFEGIDKSPKVRTWRKRLLLDPPRWPFPPDSPVYRTPADPIDRRPQAKDRQAYVNWPVVVEDEEPEK